MSKWEIPSCNNCGSSKFRVVFEEATTWEHPGIFRIVKCTSCDLVYLSPRPLKREIGKFYPKESYWGTRDISKDIVKNDYKKERESSYSPLYKLILTKKKKGSILDIGAGIGLFLTKFAELGWEVAGVELSSDATRFAKRTYGIDLRVGDFLDFSFPKNHFDVVTLNNSLEHLYQPRQTLEGASRILSENGILVITVPNIESFGAKILGKNWHPLQPPRHLYHFSPKTLSDMLSHCRFFVVKVHHNYWVHNYYSLFESFRFFFSPRFKKKRDGVLVIKEYKKHPSIVLELGKVVGNIFAFTFSLLGAIFRRGEVIIVYAKKK